MKSRFVAAFGVTIALIASWGVWRFASDFLDSGKIAIDPATIKYNSIAGNWSVQAYNGSGRKVDAILVRITLPITGEKRVFRFSPGGILGKSVCSPYSLGDFRADVGRFLADKRIHGAWKLVGVEFSR